MYHSTLRNTIFLLLTGYTLIASGFVPPMATSLSQSVGTTTLLSARRWNFNDGQAPWGLKQNAEIWNGRVAQMAFIMVYAQEAISGKGVLEGIQSGDAGNVVGLAVFGVSVVALTAWLAIQGDDDYVKRDLERLSRKQ